MTKGMTFEERIALIAKRNGLCLKWQPLKFGFKRAVIECDSFEEFGAAKAIAGKIKDATIDSWLCAAGGVFEGYVYVMNSGNKEKLDEMLSAENRRIEDWWQRYHAADEETRRLMACGAIT